MSENPVLEARAAEEIDSTSLESFFQSITELKQGIKRQYDRNINKDLSRQNWQDLFKRNVTSVLQQAYNDSLIKLRAASLSPETAESQHQFSSLAIQALKPFEGLVDDLMQYALQKHRTSCALSNFPDEHQPSIEYIAEVTQETDQDWRAFASEVNRLLTVHSIN
jgi:monoamine oxidase